MCYSLWYNAPTMLPAGIIPVHYTTSCNTQSSAPENGQNICPKYIELIGIINPYPTAFPYGNGMVLHFYQQQESSTTKTVHKVINKGLKTYV